MLSFTSASGAIRCLLICYRTKLNFVIVLHNSAPKSVCFNSNICWMITKQTIGIKDTSRCNPKLRRKSDLMKDSAAIASRSATQPHSLWQLRGLHLLGIFHSRGTKRICRRRRGAKFVSRSLFRQR